MIRSVGGADGAVRCLEFAAVQDMVDGDIEEGAGAFPGGLEATAATAVLKHCFLDESGEGGGPGRRVEITHEQNGAFQLGNLLGALRQIIAPEIGRGSGNRRDWMGDSHVEK